MHSLQQDARDILAGSLMIDYLFTIVPLFLAATIAIYTVRHIILRPQGDRELQVDLPSGIPLKQIGLIERDLTHLRTVIVLADTVERPTAELSEAVEYNFSRGVKYLFLVSNNRLPQQLDGYYGIFEALARIVLKRTPNSSATLRDLIDIQQLPYNWDDYPYIFYRLELPSGEIKTLAFRGDKLHKGIAEHYGRVDPIYAHTIARAIMADAPRPLPVTDFGGARDQFNITVAPELSAQLPQSKTIQ